LILCIICIELARVEVEVEFGLVSLRGVNRFTSFTGLLLTRVDEDKKELQYEPINIYIDIYIDRY
jgi:hypothetical protein